VTISPGLNHARGRAVVILDSDLQDPPEVIPALIARPGETRFKLLTAALFYRLIARITAMDIPCDVGDVRRLAPREVGERSRTDAVMPTA